MHAVHSLAAADLNLLVVLDDLLRSGSTTLTSRRLGRTQSAVSHALGRLRVLLGDPLFVRAGTTLRPTAVAESLREPLRTALLHAEAVLTRSSAAFDPRAMERTFTIACADYMEVILLPRLLPMLRKAAPGVDIVTRFVGDDVERVVQAREIDLAYGSRLRGVSGVVSESIGEETMTVLLRRGHPALTKRLTPRTYAALDHVLVTPRGLPGSSVDTALEPLRLTRRIVLRVPHFAAAAIIVSKTDLVVTLPSGFASEVAKSLKLVAVPVPFPIPGFTFAIAYNAAFQSDPGHTWFRERLMEAGRAARGTFLVHDSV